MQFGGGAVDPTGQVVRAGQAGVRVQIVVGPGITVESAPVVITDGTGEASWVLRCLQPGPVSVSLMMTTTASAVTLPPCTEPPPGTP